MSLTHKLARQHYVFFGYVLMPILFLFAVVKGYKRKESIKDTLSRFGLFAPLPRGAIHLHAVSLGEVTSAIPLVETLLASEGCPPIVFTTMTKSGRNQIKQQFGKRVTCVYLPFDINGVIKSFVERLQPKGLILVEAEWWPNLLHHYRVNHLPVVLINGRMTDASRRAYGRFPRLMAESVNALSFAMMQTAQDRDNLIALGLEATRIQVSGSVKFDVPTAAENASCPLQIEGCNGAERKVLIAGSTHWEDEQVVLEAFEKVRSELSNALLVLAPRKLERIDALHHRLEEVGYGVCRFSQVQHLHPSCDILLIDTFGDLASLYQLADVAFIGGSLADKGGHNPLEAVVQRVPVVMGPHTYNCHSIVSKLQEKDAIAIIHNASEMADKVLLLMNDSRCENQFSQRAYEVICENKGVTKSYFELISKCFGFSV